MKKKTLIIFAAYFCLLILDSCSSHDDDCSFSPQPPFYDFQSIIITPNQNEIATGEKLELNIQLDEVDYLTFSQPKFSLGLINKAYGCSPVPPGYDGPKFPIEKIEITSDQNFNTNLPALSSLNELITVRNNEELIPLNQANMDQLNFLDAEFVTKDLIFEAVPSELNVEHTFTITMTKSNGAIVEKSVSGIVWK